MKKNFYLILALAIVSFFFDFSLVNAASKKIQFAENNVVADIMCSIFGLTQTILGRAIMILILVVTGIGFMMGKGSWGVLLGICMGMTIMFSAEKLVGVFVGGKGVGGCGCKNGVSGEFCSQKPA